MVFAARTQGSPADAQRQSQWSISELTVSGTDVAGVDLILHDGLQITGKLQVEGQGWRPEFWASVRVRLDLFASVANSVVASVKPQEDGSFAIRGVVPGRYKLGAVLGPAIRDQWRVGSTRALGVETQEAGLVLMGPSDVSDAVIDLTSQQTSVVGRVLSASRVPAGDVRVLAFPADPALRVRGSWRVRPPVRVEQDGRYQLVDLPPGDYLLTVLPEGVSEGEETFAASQNAVTVSVRRGDKVLCDLQLAADGRLSRGPAGLIDLKTGRKGNPK
jgi:hypothetical protein